MVRRMRKGKRRMLKGRRMLKVKKKLTRARRSIAVRFTGNLHGIH